MTERGLPTVDGAPACPFVAFEDDRDERASSPDHRHRCYAEVHPAPRALAHQEAYCLSSAFPVCPTFQDWARREAARARRDEAIARADEDEGGARRNPRRDWSAPPPWLEGEGRRAGSGRFEPEGGEGEDEADVAPLSRAAGLSGGFADRLLGREGEPDTEEAVAPPEAPLPPAPRRAAAPVGRGTPRSAGRDARDLRDERADHDEDAYEDDDLDADEYEGDEEGTAALAGGAASRRRRRDRDRDLGRGADPDEGRRPLVADGRARRDLDGPSWERPQRLEAYPTIRKRRMSGVAIPSSLVLAVVAIALAAVALFFLPQLFLGTPGGANATPTPTAGTAGSASPSEAAPSTAPAPTPQIYLVQAGDTMSKIAKRFNVPLQVLIDANKDTIPNPDSLQIGQQVTIPPAGATAAPAALTAAPQ